MTLQELIYSVQEAIRPSLKDDDIVDQREVSFQIRNQRALWIKNDLNKSGRAIDDNTLQTICMDVDLADPSDCCDIKTKCTILKSKVNFPSTIPLNGGDRTIFRIGPVNLMKSNYLIIPYHRAAFVGNGRFNKDFVYSFLYNWNIFIISNPGNALIRGIKKIAISAIFENPEDTKAFEGCSGLPCYTDDSRYPISSWMWNYIQPMVIRHFLPQLILPEKPEGGKGGVEEAIKLNEPETKERYNG